MRNRYKTALLPSFHRKIAVKSDATIAATWAWGSRVLVTFSWGDGTTDTQNLHANDARVSLASHNYSQPGTYYPTVNIKNYIRDCSVRSLPLTAPVIVDYAIPSSVLVGRPITLLAHPDLDKQSHFVSLRFQLCYGKAEAVPVYTWMQVTYGDTYNETLMFVCNASALSGEQDLCPTTHSYCASTPLHKYFLTGAVKVTATLWNIVSNRVVTFDHHIYSEVKTVSLSLFVMPLGNTSADPTTAAPDLWHRYCRVAIFVNL